MSVLILLCETLGTFLLVLAVLASGNWLVIGLTLAAILWLVGDISGGHVNPAITLVMYMNGSFTGVLALQYVLAQVVGGLSALYTYRMLM